MFEQKKILICDIYIYIWKRQKKRKKKQGIIKKIVKNGEEKNFGNKFAKNVLMLIIAQILVKVLGLIYRVVIVNVPGFRKCREPDIMPQDMRYMHLCLHYQVQEYLL